MSDFGSYCLTEPGAGSDAAAITTTAIRDGDDYVLTGVKQFISGGGRGIRLRRHGAHRRARRPRDHRVPRARATPPGLSFGANEKKMGWNAQPTRQVILDEVRVPAIRACSACEGQGFKIAMSALNGGRVNIAACSLGGAQWALDRAVQYVHERFTFGEPLAEKQSVVFTLADMATELRAARALVRDAATALDEKAPDAVDAVRDGQALRDGCRLPHRERGAAAARRLRLPPRVRHREGRARPARAPDPRGHERDHARHHRPRAAREQLDDEQSRSSGLGHMGLPMAKNLAAAGHEVVGFDVFPAAIDAARAAGLAVADVGAGCRAGGIRRGRASRCSRAARR